MYYQYMMMKIYSLISKGKHEEITSNNNLRTKPKTSNKNCKLCCLM